MLSTAILKFLSEHLQIKSIIQKFSEPGHSQIQEVDCVHSALYKYLKRLEIHSILSLVNYLKNFYFLFFLLTFYYLLNLQIIEITISMQILT